MKIVLGYDGSASSRRALDAAAELADGGPVSVVSVTKPFAARGTVAPAPIQLEDHTRDLEEARARLAVKGVEAYGLQGFGDPAGMIVREAEAERADLIVVGCEHKNLLERLLVGSVSNQVVHAAKTSVLVVS